MVCGVQVRVRFLSGDEEELDGFFETATHVRVHLTQRFPNSFANEITLIADGSNVDLGDTEVPPPLVTAVLQAGAGRHDDFYVKAALAHARAHDNSGLARLANAVRSTENIQRRPSISSFGSEVTLCTMTEGSIFACAMIEYLHICEECDDVVVSSLINAHADVNYQDVPRARRSGVLARSTGAPKRQDGRTALWLASLRGHLDTVRSLLCAGADVSLSCRFGRNCVAASLVSGNSAMVKVLVDHQCDINGLDTYGESPLIMACSNGLTNGVAALVPYANNLGRENSKKGLHINVVDPFGWTPLLHASSNGYEDIAAMLLNSKAEISEKDRQGRTALDLAQRGKHVQLEKLLVEHGAVCKANIPRQTNTTVSGG